ncbi:hypothetical protein OG233_13945 [Streptomyces sp. NBC_01218]|uniref:hypothetical protein n=1 Tax=Streptomyces sp. NBC_01218 TaxID=2903780 RepID=UPI002E13D6C3|nr:hypothetical protein OG233_13945 [Streptomyces sp. NBC_01218]
MSILAQPTDPRQATPGQTEPATLSLAEVMDLPLGQIISRLRIRIIDSSITDDKFYGGLHIGHGRITILTSPGRDKSFTECALRCLIAQALGHDITPIPKPFEMEITDYTERAREAALKAVMK